MSCSALLWVCVGLLVCHKAVGVDHPEDFVNLLQGTFTDGNVFSTGNTLPLVGYPWGFNHWAPMSRDNNRGTGSWWFKGNEHKITWMRCTHQPSPWIGDWAWFLFGPQIGGNNQNPERNPTMFWEPRAATIKPHLFDATLAPDNLRMELVPSMHGALYRVTFPEAHETKRICFTGMGTEWGDHGTSDKSRRSGLSSDPYKEKIGQPSGKPYITGKANQVHIERLIVANFNMHVRAESDEATGVDGMGDMMCFKYDTSATTVTVLMATSMISKDMAVVNLNRELRYVSPTHSKEETIKTPGIGKDQFETVANHAAETWRNLLKRVDVVDPGPISGEVSKQLTVFYSGLARALSFPRRTDEVDVDGNIVHYSPYSPTGGIYNGPGVTDNGFWDTFRTVYPMLSLLYPDHLAEIVQGWLNAFKEGGWLPSWASPGYRNCMVGTFADVVVSDAIVKGIEGFDKGMAREALIKDSFVTPPGYAGNAIGKEGLGSYEEHGFVPLDVRNRGVEVVSRSLDFGFADFAVSKAFKILAKDMDIPSKLQDELKQKANHLAGRSDRVIRSLFDKGQGLMVPKQANGQGAPGFRDKEWGNGFTEGNSWHHSFPPYAVSAGKGESGGELARLHGSKANLLNKLHQMLTTNGKFMPGSYGQEIHEMVEARAVAMGQYAHNNQPVHHILWLFALLGERSSTEKLVRFVMHHAYGTDFFAGDEDNGEQGAWYVLAALGLFSATPGTTELVVGSPVFRHVRIQREPANLPDPYISGNGAVGYRSPSEKSRRENIGEKFLDIVALGTSTTAMHVQKLSWNNRPVDPSHVTGDEIVPATVSSKLLEQDGVLRFVMRGEEEIPFSRPRGTDTLTDTPASVSAAGGGSAIAAKVIKRAEQAEKREQDAVKEIKRREERIHNLEINIKEAKADAAVQKTISSKLQERLIAEGHDAQHNLNLTAIHQAALAAAGDSGAILKGGSMWERIKAQDPVGDAEEDDSMLWLHISMMVLALGALAAALYKLRGRGLFRQSAFQTPTKISYRKSADDAL